MSFRQITGMLLLIMLGGLVLQWSLVFLVCVASTCPAWPDVLAASRPLLLGGALALPVYLLARLDDREGV